jgi:hypothetical protein
MRISRNSNINMRQKLNTVVTEAGKFVNFGKLNQFRLEKLKEIKRTI